MIDTLVRWPLTHKALMPETHDVLGCPNKANLITSPRWRFPLTTKKPANQNRNGNTYEDPNDQPEQDLGNDRDHQTHPRQNDT